MIIGITGGSGSGKSTLLELIRQQGGLVLDCDRIYHELLQTDKALLDTISAQFPGTVKNGILDRKKLGAIVFSDPVKLARLNTITHKAVKSAVLDRLPKEDALVAIDAFALFEGGLAELCKLTVAVTAPVEARIQRLMARDGITREYAAARIGAQPSDEAFSSLCNYTLENNGALTDFQTKCLAFLRKIGIMETE